MSSKRKIYPFYFAKAVDLLQHALSNTRSISPVSSTTILWNFSVVENFDPVLFVLSFLIFLGTLLKQPKNKKNKKKKTVTWLWLGNTMEHLIVYNSSRFGTCDVIRRVFVFFAMALPCMQVCLLTFLFSLSISGNSFVMPHISTFGPRITTKQIKSNQLNLIASRSSPASKTRISFHSLYIAQ